MINDNKNSFDTVKAQNRGLKILIIGLVIALLGIVILLITLLKDVNELSNQLLYIRSDLSNINSSVAVQTQNMINDFSSTLETESSLVASYDVNAENLKVQNGQLPITISLIPKNDYKDMTLELQIIGNKTYVQTAVSNNGIYTVRIPVDITENNLKFMAKFNHNGVITNEALDIYSDLLSSFLMRTDAESELSFQKIAGNLNIVGRVISIYDPLYGNSGMDSTPKCYPVKGAVIIKVNDQEVKTEEILLDGALNEGYYSDCHIYTSINTVLEQYNSKDKVVVISRFIDNYGNVYEHEINQYPE